MHACMQFCYETRVYIVKGPLKDRSGGNPQGEVTRVKGHLAGYG